MIKIGHFWGEYLWSMVSKNCKIHRVLPPRIAFTQALWRMDFPLSLYLSRYAYKITNTIGYTNVTKCCRVFIHMACITHIHPCNEFLFMTCIHMNAVNWLLLHVQKTGLLKSILVNGVDICKMWQIVSTMHLHHLVEEMDPGLTIVIGQSWCSSWSILTTCIHHHLW